MSAARVSNFDDAVVFEPSVARHLWHGQREISFASFWRQLLETANPNTMHTEDMSPAELKKQASFESLDYYKPYPDIYVEYLREYYRERCLRYLQPPSSPTSRSLPAGGHYGEGVPLSPPQPVLVQVSDGESSAHVVDPGGGAAVPDDPASPLGNVAETLSALQKDSEERHLLIRWFLHVLIAVSVGVVATFVSYAVDIIEHYRAGVLYRIMAESPHRSVGLFWGLIYAVASSVALVAVAAGVVVFFEPAAAGGGIPDVMAYLNGVHLRKAMNLRTFIAKGVSCVCAVAGGLPVGLEAPLIHLGAITGAGVTQGRSRTLGFQTNLFQAFRNNKDRRDFITAGAACGVSVAFGAPIGGLLFVMEEVSSFWDYSSSGQIFLATMLCFTISTMINSVVEDRRLLGWVSNAAAVLFEVNVTIPLNLVSIVPSCFLGILIGSLAALFTKLNLLLIKWRRRVLRPYPLRRFMEPIVIVALFSALMYLVSLCAPCSPLYQVADHNASVYVWGTEKPDRLLNSTCFSSKTYSPLGTLSLASGKGAIRHLFTRQTALEFPVLQLALYFVIFFAFACWSSGTAVSGGLVVPSLVLGAVFGRLFGVLLFMAGVSEMPGVERGYPVTEAWMDPGVFALIGAGAFLAGTSRMSMAICVIMVELSSELHYLLPVMVAIVMSKTTADWLSEPLYHQMLHMDSVPYLPANIVKAEFEQLTAADVMACPVVTLHMRERTEVVVAALRDTTHHAFPVVEVEEAKGSGIRGLLEENGSRTAPLLSGKGVAASTSDDVRYKFVGLVTREDLQVYFTLPQLQEYDATVAAAATAPVAFSEKDSDGYGGRLAPCILDICKMTWRQWVRQKNTLFLRKADRYGWVRDAVPRGGPAVRDCDDGDDSHDLSTAMLHGLPPVVDLSLIVNRSPWVIPPFFNLQMAYHTFRMMGLRHMVVVDGDAVAGIITRKDLLVDSLRRRMKELSSRIAEADNSIVSTSGPPSYISRGRDITRVVGESTSYRGASVLRPAMNGGVGLPPASVSRRTTPPPVPFSVTSSIASTPVQLPLPNTRVQSQQYYPIPSLHATPPPPVSTSTATGLPHAIDPFEAALHPGHAMSSAATADNMNDLFDLSVLGSPSQLGAGASSSTNR